MLVSKVRSHCSLGQVISIVLCQVGGHLLIQLTDVTQHVLKGGIVDQDVDSTHALDGRIHHLFAVFLFADVDGEAVALTPGFFHPFLCFLCIFLLFWQVDDQARGALHGKQDCRSPTNAGVTSRDNGPLPLELAGGLVELIPTIIGRDVSRDRLGVLHLGLQTWLGHMLNGDFMACMEPTSESLQPVVSDDVT